MRRIALLVSMALLVTPATGAVTPREVDPMVIGPPPVPGIPPATWPLVAAILRREGLLIGAIPAPVDADTLAAALLPPQTWEPAATLAAQYAHEGDRVWAGYLLGEDDQRTLLRRWRRVDALAASFHLAWPVSAHAPTTSPYGGRVRPLLGGWRHHDGVDLGLPVGTPIHAAQAGRVARVGWSLVGGRYVVIDHPDGLRTRYLHLDRAEVRAGQSVSRGQSIGASGRSGRVTGPHLHFEVELDGVPLDPERFRAEASDPNPPSG